MVKASTASIPPRPRVRSTGNQSRPRATGITPTNRPIAAKISIWRAPARGVSRATGITCSNFVPVDDMMWMVCASPATHG